MIRKQLEAETRKAKLWPTLGALVNPGDLVARLGDGSACPLSAWPRTGDPEAERRAFCAAFTGVSNDHHDPEREGKSVLKRPLGVHVGGAYEFAVAGEKVAKGTLVGPAIVDGKLADESLAAVADLASAVGEVVAASGGGWKVQLRGA